jgi:hypothetical protein
VKERIEEWALNITHMISERDAAPAHEAAIVELTRAVNEALELAAKECEQSDKSTHPSDLAEAIRKLKEQS